MIGTQRVLDRAGFPRKTQLNIKARTRQVCIGLNPTLLGLTSFPWPNILFNGGLVAVKACAAARSARPSLDSIRPTAHSAAVIREGDHWKDNRAEGARCRSR